MEGLGASRARTCKAEKKVPGAQQGRRSLAEAPGSHGEALRLPSAARGSAGVLGLFLGLYGWDGRAVGRCHATTWAADALKGAKKTCSRAEKSTGAAISPRWLDALCITLGELLAQPLGCPHRRAMPHCCPRSRDSGTRVLRTGLAATQVLVRPQEKALVHRKAGALLLRLCIYKEIKKKTENNIRVHPHPVRGWKSTGHSVLVPGPVLKARGRETSALGQHRRGPGKRLEGAFYPGLRRKASSRSTGRGRLKR